MIHYLFDCKNPQNQYIDIQVKFTATAAQHEIQLPSWRPGRYELSDFAKNVKMFKVFVNGKVVESKKITKDRWIVSTEIGKIYTIAYQYYAAELNGGSTYFSNEQLYVNPVNCCVYIDGMQDLPCEIQLNVPENFTIACGMKKEGNILNAKNFDELADSPWIASPSLLHDFYEVNGVCFNLWFQGECKPDFDRIKIDFIKFTQKQVNSFGEFPFEEYHFFFQIVPFTAYHGVEHLNSTVIYLGPSFNLMTANYSELLGVSSHELYHAWNVKSIRPIELFPYDFTKENYSQLGYLCEGVTTYMGDLMLYRSGVFDLKAYLKEFEKQLKIHFDNFARFTTNVAESSFDTWLDGYVAGAPNRKLSIYTEGCLLSFVVDVLLLHYTNGKNRLDDVMKRLYYDFYLNEKGVSEDDYWAVIRNMVGDKLEYLYHDFYHGTKNYESILIEAFDVLGFDLMETAVKSYSEANLGFKSTVGQTGVVVKAIYPGSPADIAKLMLEDEIISVNGVVSNHEIDEWLRYFDLNEKCLMVIRGGKLIELTLPEVSRSFYLDYKVIEVKTKSNQQQKMFKIWSE